MKKKSLLWLILIVASLALVGYVLRLRYGDTLRSRKNKFADQEISFSYPDQWNVITGTSNPYLVVTLTAPQKDEYTPTFNVTKEKVADGMSLDSYVEQTKNQLKSVIRGYQQDDIVSTTIDGQPAKKLHFTGRYLDKDFSREQIYTIKGDTVYVITYLALNQAFENGREEIDRAFDTFSFN